MLEQIKSRLCVCVFVRTLGLVPGRQGPKYINYLGFSELFPTRGQ